MVRGFNIWYEHQSDDIKMSRIDIINFCILNTGICYFIKPKKKHMMETEFRALVWRQWMLPILNGLALKAAYIAYLCSLGLPVHSLKRYINVSQEYK